MSQINDLSDYPAIKKLAMALHKFNANQLGAAIMVGAGFSRSAARHVTGKRKMPLWNSFSEKLMGELKPNDSNLSFSDPLRVAEEYRAYFGQAALNDKIRSEIDNDSWLTGDLYQLLLELPWSEIMTTNWDTLLERAAENIHGPYYTSVTKLTDLAWAPSPRIVKLHGTIGVTDTFIAAQEDYRTYPAKFAPFVNFARQVFIENELCLLGFSGDDPNFLQWAGWVRDHLAGHARKIYLVGALNLNAARRRHLESINIAPVDLWDAVKHIGDADIRHQKAIELFLNALKDEAKAKKYPYEWEVGGAGSSQTPTDVNDFHRQYSDPEYAASLLKGKLESLKMERESYPGWVICPPGLRGKLSSQLSSPLPTDKIISALTPEDRAKLLYEIAWRKDVAFEYIPPWLAQKLQEIAVSDEEDSINHTQKNEIALILLRNSRWLEPTNDGEKSVIQDHIETLITRIKKYSHYSPDSEAELAYHMAIQARDELDYQKMEELVEDVAGEDPIWKLKKAALLMELGRFDEGARLISTAYGEFRQHYRRDRHSVYTLSRLVLANWLLRSAHLGEFRKNTENLPEFAEGVYRKWKCDPWDWIEDLQDAASRQEELNKTARNPIEPLFRQGHYRDNSSSHSSEYGAGNFIRLEGLSRCAGIPLRSGRAFSNVNLLARLAEKFVITGGSSVELWNLILAIRAASSEDSLSIKESFSRIGVAKISLGTSVWLFTRVIQAINYWREKRNTGTKEQQQHALSALRVFIEVLARLTIRTSREEAKECFLLGVSIGQQKNLQHPWIMDSLDSLLTNSLESIPLEEHGELLLDALKFPLQSELAVSNMPHAPNPIIDNPNRRETYPEIDSRIAELIGALTPLGTPSSTASLLRLLPLVEANGFLTTVERKKISDALWVGNLDGQSLPNTGLLPHVLLIFPVHESVNVEGLVRKYLYEPPEGILADTNNNIREYPSPKIQQAISIFLGMASAAENKTTKLLPSPEQAKKLFDLVVGWRPRLDESDPLLGASTQRLQLARSIGDALSYAIVPALTNENITTDRFIRLKKFHEETKGASSALRAMVYFVSLNEEASTDVEKTIKKSLHAYDINEVGYAALSIQKWCELPNQKESSNLNGLITKLLAVIESGRTTGLYQLIMVAESLSGQNILNKEQLSMLSEAVLNIFNASDYANIDPNSREAVSASSIREACIKLANTLIGRVENTKDLQELLGRAATDPLPEVRLSVSKSQS